MKTSPMDFLISGGLYLSGSLRFGWEPGFEWKILDCGGDFGLYRCFLGWVGASLLEIFAGLVLLSFLTHSQVGVLDLGHVILVLMCH